MLQRGDSVPHFDVTTVAGERFSYSTIWQRRNVVLVVLAGGKTALTESYVSRLAARMPEFTARAAEFVVTRDRVPGIDAPAIVVADKWGEIAYVAAASQVDDLPSPQELLAWVDYLEGRCPECEGEAR